MKYKKKKFESGSRGLDNLVERLQKIPGHRVGMRMRMTNDPGTAEAMDTALKLIERISNLSPDSPGGEHIDEAIKIGYAVYAHLQECEDVYMIESRPSNVVTMEDE